MSNNIDLLNHYLMNNLPQAANNVSKILESLARDSYEAGFVDGYNAQQSNMQSTAQILKYKGTADNVVYTRQKGDTDVFYSQNLDAVLMESDLILPKFKPISACNDNGVVFSVNQHVIYDNIDCTLTSILPPIGDEINTTVSLQTGELVIVNINALNV